MEIDTKDYPDTKEARMALFSQIDFNLMKRILDLRKNPELGAEAYEDPILEENYSNCLGTSLYVHDLVGNGRPSYVSGELFSFNPDLFENDKRPGSIFLISGEEPDEYHSGIWMGKFDGLDYIFHQRGYPGQESEDGLFDTMIFDLLMYKYDGKTDLTFYYPRGDKKQEIRDTVLRSSLEKVGLTPEVFREVNAGKRAGLSEARVDEGLMRMSYDLHVSLMEKLGKPALDFDEFRTKSLVSHLAMSRGVRTAAAVELFVYGTVPHEDLERALTLAA